MAHLTNEDRGKIEQFLRERKSLKSIGKILGKDTSTISREIKKHLIESDKGAFGRITNRCINRTVCCKYQVCENKPNCTRKCSSCHLCNKECMELIEEICTRLSSPPYVCSGCIKESACVLRKKYYLHGIAQKEYRELLVNCRSGVNITEDELLQMDRFVSPLIQKGQSVHHIVSNNPDEMIYCEKSIYRYVNSSLLAAKNIDMPRVCRMKPRKTKPLECKVDKKCRIDRTFADYQHFIYDHPDLPVVELDSVEGRKGSKVLLTMMIKNCGFMLAFIRDRNTSQSVIDVFNDLYNTLGSDLFKKLFPACLTDNGSEFSNPLSLEFAPDGSRRTFIFYCDPYSSFQKPNVENNHELIRRILPKGVSFDNLSQQDIDLMMSHINSYSREKLNDKSPYSAFSFLYGQDIPDILHAKLISPNDISLRPALIKK